MANSGTVTASDLVLYSQYNNLRADVLNATTGHGHTGGTDEGKKLSGAVIGGSVNWGGYSLGSPGSISGTPLFTGTPTLGSIAGNPRLAGSFYAGTIACGSISCNRTRSVLLGPLGTPISSNAYSAAHEFPDAAVTTRYFHPITIPYDAISGTFYIIMSANGTGNYYVELDLYNMNNGGSIAAAAVASGSTAIGWGTATFGQVNPSVTLGTGYAGSIFQIVVTRHGTVASDTCTGSAFAHAVEFNYGASY